MDIGSLLDVREVASLSLAGTAALGVRVIGRWIRKVNVELATTHAVGNRLLDRLDAHETLDDTRFDHITGRLSQLEDRVDV